MLTRRFKDFYTLRKLKKNWQKLRQLYLKKAKVLDAHAREKIEAHLANLQKALSEKDVARAQEHFAHLAQSPLSRSTWEKVRDGILSLVFALCIAIVVRQMWFEFYTIPTGSMRPTLKESDFLVVSKTTFGLNVPLRLSHFYFNPTSVQRGDIVVFTGEGMDIPDVDMMYFYLFPGKKQFVKRLIAKPGDTVYFYGGKIYGIDSSGKELRELLDPPWFQTLEHIPFIRLNGKAETAGQSAQGLFLNARLYQMNQPIAKIQITPFGTVQGEMLVPGVSQLSDLWGFQHFGMARLLSEKELEQSHPGAKKNLEKGVLYLEIAHHPSLKQGRVLRDEMNRIRPDPGVSFSILPLQLEHLAEIADHMTTARFFVKDEKARRIGMSEDEARHSLPKLADVPDGTYEIQDGKAYKVWWGGIAEELPSEHPFYRKDPEWIQLLYNQNGYVSPPRYAYFRDQALYLLGHPILQKEDPALVKFLEQEREKAKTATSEHPYFPFEDRGPPLRSDGTLDAHFIRKFGLHIPEKMYLVLGDNHAMSADSREFGFVPEANLKGSVSFLFSPPGPRWGIPQKPSHPFATGPNLFVWITALGIGVGYWMRRKKIGAY